MSPQLPDFNRKKWTELEDAVRQLDAEDDIFETYVLTCPVFYFDRPIKSIGEMDGVEGDKGNRIPVPHAFIKSVLAEDKAGKLHLWTFEMENAKLDGDLSKYLVKTYDAEQLVGGRFWDRVSGGDLHNQKKTPNAMWAVTPKPPRGAGEPQESGEPKDI